MASLRVVRLTFNYSDNSFSLGNLSPAEKRFSIVIIDNSVSAILCESILFFMGYITSAFFDIILCAAVNFKQNWKYYLSIKKDICDVWDSVVVGIGGNVYNWLSFGIVGNSVCRMWESCTLAFPYAVNRVIHDSIACYAHFHNACLLVFCFFCSE